jgi:subtilisin-like proprotein convertase family protein
MLKATLPNRTRLGILLSAVMLAAFLGASLRPSQTAQALTHTQSGDITIPASGSVTPYPSTVFVQGEPGLITDINVRLVGLTHTWPDDLDILLEHEPSGIAVMIMSDACGSTDLDNATILFDDEAAGPVPDTTGCSSAPSAFSHHQPTNHGAGDVLPLPAPGSYLSTLSAFDGITPNGVWNLWVFDDLTGDSGLLDEWRLEITAGSSAIVIPAGPTYGGNANPYPYNITISGRTGLITDVNVTVSRLSHTWPGDIDMLLVSPDGDKVLLMADACGGDDVRSINLIFDQSAATTLPGSNCISGTYRPTSGTFNGSTPAPAGPYGTSLNDFNGENPNGTWQVYIYDDFGSDTGFIIDGITLDITTGPSTIQIPATGTSGNASAYPYNINVTGLPGVVTDVNVNVTGLTHTWASDIDMLLVSPNGIPVMLMSDACVGERLTAVNFEFNDETAAVGPAGNLPRTGCTSGIYRPTNYDTDETMPAPAPGLPYHDRLSIFDGIDPNGIWQLFIVDDASPDAGFITGSVTLNITTTGSLPTIIINGNFSSGKALWNEFGDGSGSVISGVYQFQRTGANAFTVFQNTSANWPTDRPFEVRFDAGNSGTDTKRLTVVLWDAAFGRQRACSFWLGPNQPLTTYQIVSDSAAAWNGVTIHFYASTQSTNGFYRLDNVVMRERPDLPTDSPSVRETICVDPRAPFAPNGTDSANLLNNAGFATLPGSNSNETWGTFGNIAVNLFSGYLRMQQTGTPAGSLIQNTNVPFLQGDTIEFQVDLGNSHPSNWQRVTILLHNENFNGLQFCTFWIAPNTTTLGTYTMRTFANSNWNADGISASIYPSTNSQWILVDNTVLRRRYTKVIGTGCYEPGSMQPAMDDLAWMQELEAAQEMLPELLPTQVPYSPPGAPMEIPLLVSPADYQPEAESSAEGAVTEGSAGG